MDVIIAKGKVENLNMVFKPEEDLGFDSDYLAFCFLRGEPARSHFENEDISLNYGGDVEILHFVESENENKILKRIKALSESGFSIEPELSKLNPRLKSSLMALLLKE